MWEFLESKTFWLILTIVGLTYIYLRHFVFNYWTLHGVPHEQPSLLLGNLTWDFITAKISLGNWLKQSYDKFRNYPFHGLYVFGRPVLMINDPALIRTVLVQEFSRFCDRGWLSNMEKIDPMTANLFLQPEHKWRRLRQKFSPTFTPNKMRQFHPLMAEIGQQMVEACDEELLRSGRSVLEVKDIVGRYTTDIISSVVYGFNCNSLKDPDHAFRRLGERAFEFGRFNQLLGIFLPELPGLVALPFYHREVRDFFAKLFKDMVERRREAPVDRKDFMNLLIELMDRGSVKADDAAAEEESEEQSAKRTTDDQDLLSMSEAAAQAFVFFLAGFETSASTATWALLELAMNQDIQHRLQREIDQVADGPEGFTFEKIESMEYLDMVLSETFRKYSAVAFLNRLCVEEYRIPGTSYTVPRGMRLVISSHGVHHDPDIYPRPHEFDPERWRRENVAAWCSTAQLQFGAGPRNCIGKRFGLLQAKQALVSLLGHFEFRVSDETRLPCAMETETMVQTPKHGVLLRAERRRKRTDDD
ncbi:cytochrome P450 6a2-like [Trichogramma pretiosum]|uniref:cytochrome P450 6a2-like n=1 Tax=Trichogramma pretiosum TaxID=7493 RepID=UPI000C71C86D|nr:cytochrome P450 6a2-like [Trichogramma pretiosum]